MQPGAPGRSIAGVSAKQYWLSVGSTGVGSSDIYSGGQGLQLSRTVAGVPTSGTVFVRLWTLWLTGWVWNDYTYNGGLPVKAVMTSPAAGSTLAGSQVTFT